jgi:hypothetical protein
LEEFRRDDPFIKARIDHEAEVMANNKSANPSTVIDAIRETRAEMLEIDEGRGDLER